MRLQQILLDLRPPNAKSIIRGQRVTNFLHLAGRGDHPFAVQNRSDLRFAQGIALDSQRAANGTDTVDAPQPQRFGLVGQHGQLSDNLADLSDQIQDGGGNGEGGWYWDGLFIPSHPGDAIDVSPEQIRKTNLPNSLQGLWTGSSL